MDGVLSSSTIYHICARTESNDEMVEWWNRDDEMDFICRRYGTVL